MQFKHFIEHLYRQKSTYLQYLKGFQPNSIHFYSLIIISDCLNRDAVIIRAFFATYSNSDSRNAKKKKKKKEIIICLFEETVSKEENEKNICNFTFKKIM